MSTRPELIRHYLSLLPSPDDVGNTWVGLSEWERKFLTSVRRYFDEHGDLTELQFNKLVEIYDDRNF